LAIKLRTLAADPIIWSAVARLAQLENPSSVAISCRVASKVQQNLRDSQDKPACCTPETSAPASASLLAKVITGCISGWSVVSTKCPSQFGSVTRQVIGRQTLQLVRIVHTIVLPPS
jgi:hypothetical protein